MQLLIKHIKEYIDDGLSGSTAIDQNPLLDADQAHGTHCLMHEVEPAVVAHGGAPAFTYRFTYTLLILLSPHTK